MSVNRVLFVADPAVPAANNLAEHSLRPLVTARKISGGTRSPDGNDTKMVRTNWTEDSHPDWPNS